MEIKTGNPQTKVSIWTDDMKIVVVSSLGDPDSDFLQIQTTKDFSNPTGSFTIVFTPKLDSNNKTWFDKLDAFDYVEIEFKGINDTESVVVMRGLIDRVSKTESWEGGIPQRNITVTGRDLASIFMDHSIYFIPALSQRKAIEAFENVGVIIWGGILNYKEQVNASVAFTTIIEQLESSINLTFGGGKIDILDKLDYKATTTFPNDVTSYGHLKTFQGAFWNALAYYQDKPFHELFLQDYKDKAYLILRPSRLKDALGSYHTSVNTSDTISYPKDFTFSDIDLISNSLEKNHDEVFNYYFTFSSVTLLEKVDQLGVFLDNAGGDFKKSVNPFFQGDPNLPAYIGKYGYRKFEASTVFKTGGYGQLPGQLAGPGSTRGQNFSIVVKKSFRDQGIERNKMLVAWFLHNEHLLRGQIEISGTNQAIIGTYAQNTSDNMEYYVEGVTHNFIQFNSFTTSLRVTRGQFSADKGGLVGLIDQEGLRYQNFNKFFFSSTGVWSK